MADQIVQHEEQVQQTTQISSHPPLSDQKFIGLTDAQTTESSQHRISAMPLSNDPQNLSPSTIPSKRVVIFGETGTGKSSLINMVAGSTVAGTSSEAQGCTFGSQGHEINIGTAPYVLWDTAGLNEGDCGTVPAKQAVQNLQQLIHDLKSDGVSLLVYCIRGTRFRDIIRVNYDLFYRIICQSQVPIVAVITGLEHESPMESWWGENAKEFGEYGLEFTGHACITTTKGKKTKTGEFMFEEEYDYSQEIVRKLIEDNASPDLWKIGDRPSVEQMGEQVAHYYQRYNNRDEHGSSALGQHYLLGFSQVHPHPSWLYLIFSWITNLPIIREVMSALKATYPMTPAPAELPSAPATNTLERQI